MADWTYTPFYVYPVEYIGPTGLVSTYEDETESRRVKSTATRRRVTEAHWVDVTSAAAMEAFYKSKGIVLAFSKVTWTPSDAPLTEANFRFVQGFKFTWAGPDTYTTTIVFLEVI
jgi:hypothetical protein